jgi:hypothetical protein
VATILTLLFPGYQLQQRKTPPHSNHTGGVPGPFVRKGDTEGPARQRTPSARCSAIAVISLECLAEFVGAIAF